MKPVFSTLIAASLVLVSPELAEACFNKTQFTRQDIAFADVIFEGNLTGISAKPRYTELTFDVQNVVRGDLPEKEFTIGWRDNYHFGARDIPISLFTEYFGETTRVAVSTPQFAGRFCEFKESTGNVLDETTGERVTQKVMRPVCSSSASSLVPVVRENLPFVLSNGQNCGSTYLYSSQTYEKMRGYSENLAAFQNDIENGLSPSRELFEERVGEGGPLPWAGFSPHPEGIVVELFREHTEFFTPFLKMNEAWQVSLMDLGVAMIKDKSFLFRAKFEKDEAALLKYRDSLKSEILKLLAYMERDPEFRNRLLEAD